MSTTNRLRTFETADDERLVIMAGRGEMDQRTIYSGSASGRYAIVPVDAIEEDWERPEYSEQLDVDGMEIVGSSATVDSGEKSTLTLLQDDEVVEQSAGPGVYGLMRIPFERD